MTFLDVGQGDAAVIETPSGRVVVIDGGGRPGTDEREGADPGTRVVVPYLRHRGISAVDLLVMTHPDEDHVQGLIAVASRLTVRAVLESGYPASRDTAAERLQRLLRTRRVPLYRAKRGQVIPLGGEAHLEVLNPPGDGFLRGGRSESNDASVVLRLVYGQTRILFTGDAEAGVEADMLRSQAPRLTLKSDVLKVGHHGSRWSSSDPFLEAVRPSAAIISVGASNRYGHPHADVVKRLESKGVRIFRTDRQGAVTVETDGRRLRITTMR